MNASGEASVTGVTDFNWLGLKIGRSRTLLYLNVGVRKYVNLRSILSLKTKHILPPGTLRKPLPCFVYTERGNGFAKSPQCALCTAAQTVSANKWFMLQVTVRSSTACLVPVNTTAFITVEA